MSAVWERRNDESDEAFEAFTMFRDMMASHGNRRVGVAAQMLGKHRNLLSRWRQDHDWDSRVAAFDAHMDSTALAIRQVSLQEYAGALNDGLQVKLAALDRIITREIASMNKTQEEGGKVNYVDLKRLVSAMSEADNLARRSAGLPTVYRSETAPNQSSGESDVFYIGGEDDE